MASSAGFGKIDELREILSDLDELETNLEKRFNRQLFRRIRRLTGSQSDWAELSGVSQATIGNWERGYTVPNKFYRKRLANAAHDTKHHVTSLFSDRQGTLGRRLDVVATNQTLNKSILRAALTDFDFDPTHAKIVPVPFEGDFDDELLAEIAEDRKNLIESLQMQARIIMESVSDTSNVSEQKIVRLFQEYERQCSSEAPNPRLLNRLGTTISRTINSDEFRDAASDIDIESADGFSRDHIELMRLYFKEALAKAQELDTTDVVGKNSEITGEEFSHIAKIMEDARLSSGDAFIEPQIPTLLKDIASEIRDLNESIALTSDPRRVEIFERRKNEAFKNGGVYVGRFVFFGALLASVSVTGIPEILTALSLMIGLTESLAPGAIRERYERLRTKFQALPALPEAKENETDEHKK
jgi:DNA-binding transcriptional regulator YiaG